MKYDTPAWEVSGSGPGSRVDLGVVTCEAMTPQCGRSVVQIMVVRVDIGVVTYEAMTPPVWEVSGSGPSCQSGYRSGDL